MLRSVREISGVHVEAVDGVVGKVEQFLFDDRNWVVRYLVVDTGPILIGRKVLLSPACIESVRSDSIVVKNSREQVRNSPEIDTVETVSRQKEIQLHDYYSWPYYWNYPVHFNSLGDAAYPEHIPFYAFPEEKRAFEAVEKDLRMETETRQSHLRETKEIRGYHIQATDEQTGHVDDYIIDDDKWVIRYLVADTRNIIPGKKVLIAPQWTKGIDWGEAVVYVDVTGEEIRNSPAYDSSMPLTREFEEKLYKYYNRTRYWERDSGK
ncbi:MAG TPA: PRC-barrel domain-containing protein [Chitinispirillaceae bacterium]|jgi:hypothetical protein|nr:PRC-barrel domain-containing protein [Chitinispirillaceae bacterium]